MLGITTLKESLFKKAVETGVMGLLLTHQVELANKIDSLNDI